MTYTGSWANLGAGILNSLASATSPPVNTASAMGAYNASDFINPGTSYDFSGLSGGMAGFSGVDWTNSIGDYSSLAGSISVQY